MLAKPVNTNRPPVGLLILVALILSLFLIPKLETFMQQTVAEEPPPPSRVLDAETERRFVSMQKDVDEALFLVKKLHHIYGIELPDCESSQSAAQYERCVIQRREYVQQMQAIKHYRELEQSTQLQEAARKPVASPK